MIYLSLPVSFLTFHIPLLFGAGVAWGATSTSNSAALTSPSTSASATTTTNISATSSASGRSANSSTTASSTNTAQYPSLTGIPDCANQCFDTAVAAANCSSVVDVNCYCVSPKFPQGIVSCISTTCPTLLNVTEQLAQQFCNLTTPSSSLSFPTPTTTRTATSGTATATTVFNSATSSVASTTATQSGAAVGLVGGRGGDSGRMVLVGLGVGIMGFVGGALCI